VAQQAVGHCGELDASIPARRGRYRRGWKGGGRRATYGALRQAMPRRSAFAFAVKPEECEEVINQRVKRWVKHTGASRCAAAAVATCSTHAGLSAAPHEARRACRAARAGLATAGVRMRTLI
jgi:hypothetical protein